MPATSFETAIVTLIFDHLQRGASEQVLILEHDIASALEVAEIAETLASKIMSDGIHAAIPLIASGRIEQGTITVHLDASALGAALKKPSDIINPRLLKITAPFSSRKRGVETKITAGAYAQAPDPTLIRALANAHRWVRALRSGTQLGEIARREGHAESYIRTRAQLAFLSPKIQIAILNGKQPPDLTLKRLTSRPLPIDWRTQQQLFGV